MEGRRVKVDARVLGQRVHVDGAPGVAEGGGGVLLDDGHFGRWAGENRRGAGFRGLGGSWCRRIGDGRRLVLMMTGAVRCGCGRGAA